MTENGDAAAPSTSLRGVRVAAAIGGIVAIVLVVLGFGAGLLFGLVALVAVPLIPLLFVLGFEALRGTTRV